MFKKFKNLIEFKPYFNRYKTLVFSLVGIVFLTSYVGMLLAYLLCEQLIGITSEAVDVTVKFTILILTFIVIRQLILFVWDKFQLKLAQNVALDIRRDIINHLLNTKYTTIQKNGTNFYIERLNDDASVVSSFLGTLGKSAVDLITSFSFLLIVYFLSWQCGIFFTFGIAELCFIEYVKINNDLKNLKEEKEYKIKANDELSKIIENVRDIKHFGLKDQMKDRLDIVGQDLLNTTYKKNLKYESFNRLATVLQWIIDSFMVIVAILWLVPTNQIAVVALLLILNYKSLMYDAVKVFTKAKNYLIQADGCAKNILSILNDTEIDHYGKESLKLKQGIITVKNLDYEVNGKKLIKDASFELKQNSLNLFIGPSIKGRNALYMILAKLWDVPRSRVYFDYTDINDLEEDSYNQSVSVVNEDVFIFNDTILNNIKIVKPESDYAKIKNACVQVGLDEEIQKLNLGYHTIIEEKDSILTPYFKLKIELARAILKESKVIILNDPNKGIKDEEQENLIETLSKLKQSRTIVVIAQKMNHYEKFTTVYEIKANRISSYINFDEYAL